MVQESEELQNAGTETATEDGIISDEALSLEAQERKIVWQAKDFSIREFHTMKSDGELILQPEYQRNFVASPQIASRLIESILLDVPIPVIYLAEEQNGTTSVIDGQQRLTSFLSYLEGKFPDGSEFKLSGLKVLAELNRKPFAALDAELQMKIRKTTIHSIIIKKESNEDIKFEIFERLNTGSTKLNEDEIRNTVYRGPYIKLLKELSDNETFHELVGRENYRTRMVYRGMVLRFLAISEKSYHNYKSSMKQFCNRELRDHRHLVAEKAEEYRKRFLHCLDLVKVVFGATAFRRYIPGTFAEGAEPRAGNWGDSQINMALYDLQMVGFVHYSKADVLGRADALREGLLDLMTGDAEFQSLIGYKTSNTDNVRRRFEIYMEFLKRTIGDPTVSARTFSLKTKQKLFAQDATCALSGQRILSIEDSEVDHILPYNKGGATTEENAQLVLRYFNRQKKDKVQQ